MTTAVSSTRPRGVLGRLFNYVSSRLGLWVSDREHENPRAVYEQAIHERLKRYAELKEAVAGILYLRNKLEAEIRDRRGEIARLAADAERAVRRSDESLAVAIVTHRHELVEDLARAEQELEGLRNEADAAKENLLHFREEIRSLEREKGRALAVFASARMRRQVRAAIDGLSVDADVRALEGVREHVAKLATEAHLDGELARGSDLRHRLAEIRGEARHEAARQEVEEIKRRLRPLAAGDGPVAQVQGHPKDPVAKREVATESALT
jgi:phage shock protein A